jgi:hypothetical protein
MGRAVQSRADFDLYPIDSDRAAGRSLRFKSKREAELEEGEESMETERSTFVIIILAGLFLMLGTLTAHAQSSPIATPTPSACSVDMLPNGASSLCATGAERPPSFLGVSGGNYNSIATDKKTGAVTCCTGTLGALVEDGSGNPLVMSTNSVLARTSSNRKSAAANELIVQPGLVDLGCWQDSSDAVAKLSDWTKINFNGGANQLDAALAKVVDEEQTPGGTPTAGVDPQGRILNLVGANFPIDQIPAGQISTTPFPFSSLFDGLPVLKMGRTSCLTSGVIDAFDAMGKVVYPPKQLCHSVGKGTAFFNHQILVIGQGIGNQTGSTCSFAKSGDAGALVVTADFECPQAIGMVFAGTPEAGNAFSPENNSVIVAVNPIQKILNKFNVNLVGKSCTSSIFASTIDLPRPGISATLRRSIARVRAVKNRDARQLLKIDAVTAVGIGAGSDSDHAALNVYVSKDTPTVRARIHRRLSGVKVRIRHAPKFQAL